MQFCMYTSWRTPRKKDGSENKHYTSIKRRNGEHPTRKWLDERRWVVCCSYFFSSGNIYFSFVSTSWAHIIIPKNKRKTKIIWHKKLTTTYTQPEPIWLDLGNIPKWNQKFSAISTSKRNNGHFMWESHFKYTLQFCFLFLHTTQSELLCKDLNGSWYN